MLRAPSQTPGSLVVVVAVVVVVVAVVVDVVVVVVVVCAYNKRLLPRASKNEWLATPRSLQSKTQLDALLEWLHLR